ncbi:hypothetical protein NLU13_8128 [Sarocladium strictum]|uniref:Peptidase S1 domain-containing protein n=1 Tax=Sarocladium strictum TaxID=5046 RepID=A0AA39GCH7_SARSR|nr:hypothetical protein NLU13_8128 [Sarocladium strictum]
MVSLTALVSLLGLAAALPNPQAGTKQLIVGGTSAATGEFPYIVSLQQNSRHFCGGVLLNANTVLTAAHCTEGSSASSVTIRAGTNRWASGGVTSRVSSLRVHPNYVSSTTDNDIAIWKLSTSIAQSSLVAYATLPTQGSDPAANSAVTVAGWGYTSEDSGAVASSLLKVTVPVVSRATCRSEYGSSAITNNMVCAGLPQGGKDSCSGDSGGPLVNASGTLVGLVSWGNGCARAGYSGVYTRVGNYVQWIAQNI